MRWPFTILICTACAACFLRLWVGMRPKLRLRFAPPSTQQSSRKRFRWKNAQKQLTRNTFAKKRAGREVGDSDYLFGDRTRNRSVAPFSAMGAPPGLCSRVNRPVFVFELGSGGAQAILLLTFHPDFANYFRSARRSEDRESFDLWIAASIFRERYLGNESAAFVS